MTRNSLPLASATRRTTLGGMAAGAAFSVFGLPVRAGESGTFRHGVASGDPDTASVVLWTRVTTSGEVTLTCEIARDLGFTHLVGRGEVAPGPGRQGVV